MRSLVSFLVMALFIALLLPLQPAHAQFATPVVDGAIGSNEYGVHTDGQNQQSTGTGQTWYMTWDNTNLYVGITNANLSEAAVIYIDKDPVSPVNGGNNSNGNLVGFNYDNTNFAHLPFRADYVTYFKDGYREFRRTDGAGGWANSTAFSGAYASGTGSVREIAIPWSDVTNGGGRPASFLFFGYLTSPGGYVYGQVPQDNPGATIGTSASYSHYYTVNSTANGASIKPFSINSVVTNSIDFAGLRHDTFDSYYRSPFGAVSAGSSVALRFRTTHLDVSGVSVRVYNYDPATDATTGPTDYPMSFLENRTENSVLYDIWTSTLTTPGAPAILYYKFHITKGSDEAFYSDSYTDDHDNLNQGGEGAASASEPFPSFQLTVYDSDFQTPEWLQNGNVYQIFPDRFRNGAGSNDYCAPNSTAGCPVFYGDQQVIRHTTWNEAIFDPRQPGPYQGAYSNQFYGGDLKGIQDKLDYLQSLGIDTIYLNPIFKARSNHRYDTDNYLEVDPALGGDAALASLQTEMERRGMRLIFDGVFNHSSSDSLYFDRYHRYGPPDGGCESTASPYRSWYNFFNNNAPCTSGDYEAWFGFDSLPAFKDDSADVRDFFYRNPTDNVVKHWYERGASGWRFDVATDISHNWWHEFRPYAKSYKPDGPLIGEVFPDASQYLAGDQLDSVMNYRFRKNVLGFVRGGVDWSDNDNSGNNKIIALLPSQFDHALRSVREDYPPQATATMLNLIDSHDTNRALYVLTETGDTGLAQAKERLKLSALFQFTYPGAPMVYYGDEGALNSPSLGNGPSGPEDDPYNRAPYPWADESGDPNIYGPVDGSVKGYYTMLAHLRKQHPSLRTGTFETLLTGDTTPSGTDNNTYAFARVSGGETAIVALNNGTDNNSAIIPVASYFAEGTQLQDALSGATYTVSDGALNITLAARGGVVLFSSPATVDTTPPDASINISQPTNYNDCNTNQVTITLNGSDSGSGIKELRYWLGNGNVMVVPGSTQTITINVCTPITINLRAIDNAGNISDLASKVVASPTAADSEISGQVIDTNGTPLGGVVVYLDGKTLRRAITDAQGHYSFEGVETGSFYTVTPSLANYVFTPASRSFTALGSKTEALFTAGAIMQRANPVDTPEFFVRQQYLDFLGREPDAGGFEYWSTQFDRCGVDADCLRLTRINISAAFFIEQESQDTGSFIYRLYRAAYGSKPAYAQFMPDRSKVVGGANLEASKSALVAEFVQRAEFKQFYPEALSNEQFVNKLFNTAGLTNLTAEREQQIALLNHGGGTRAQVLHSVIENAQFKSREYNPSFVLMEYFGYLRRDPEQGGFDFWLDVLNNKEVNNYRGMVCSFITSREYQQRFASIITRGNAECGSVKQPALENR